MLHLADINKISCEIYFGSFENMTSHSIVVSHQTQEKEKECSYEIHSTEAQNS